MSKNDFKPFAIGEYANVLSQNEYEALPAVGAGFTSGIAKSEELNKVWRQSSVMASVLGEFIANNSGDDVLDDGNTSRLLISLTRALTKPIIDVSHPVGVVAWFAQNKNPNTLFPGTSWNYIGEDRTIRLGKQDGSDILSTGGNDSVTMTVSNLPKHKFSVSGNTSTLPGKQVISSQAGAHAHDIGVSGKNARNGSVGVPPDYGYKGSDNSNEASVPLTSSAPDHTHIVDIPEHSHTVTGETNEIGSGVAINVKNSYITLMGWYRIA